MAKVESLNPCPECHESFDYPQPPPLGRRAFLRATATAAAAVAATATGGVPAVVRAAAPPRPRPAEELVRELFSTLEDNQKKRLVLAYDRAGSRGGAPMRKGTYNSPLLNLRIGDVYTRKQQELIERV